MAAERLFAPPHAHNAELALRAFEAEQHFNQALSDFQGANLPLREGTDAALFLQAANQAGFAWTLRAAHGDSVELALLHNGGAEIAITTPAAALLPTLLGLLGVFPPCPQALSAAPQPPEPEAIAVITPVCSDESAAKAWAEAAITPASAGYQALDVGRATAVAVVESLVSVAAKSRADVAARSLAAATNGAVAAGDPDGSAAAYEAAYEHLAPLSVEQKAAAVAMVGAMSMAQRKAFTIAFRNAFSVPREQVSLAPLITQIQHLEFIDRFTTEVAGEVAA